MLWLLVLDFSLKAKNIPSFCEISKISVLVVVLQRVVHLFIV